MSNSSEHTAVAAPFADGRPKDASRRATRILLIFGALLVSGGSVFAAAKFHRDPPPEETPAPGMTVGKDSVTLTPGAPEWKMIRLGTARPAAPHWTEAIPARIQIDEAKMSRVGAPLAGHVTKVFVERGQVVKAGQPLFAEVSPNLAELHAEKEKAAVDLEVARTNLERVKALVLAKALPAKEQVAAEQEFHQAEVALKLASSKLSSLRVSASGENEFTVTAPRDGTVVEKNVAVAQEVSPDANEPLFLVADLSSVWVVADLFEQDAGGIVEGAQAKVTSPSLPNQELEGTVEQVSALVDPTRHTVPIRVRLPNGSRALRPNVYAQVKFLTAAEAGGVEVAASAVVSDGAHSYVYVQDAQGKFTRRTVVAGSVRDGKVPVLKGLEPGETVVEEGTILLDNQIALSN